MKRKIFIIIGVVIGVYIIALGVLACVFIGLLFSADDDIITYDDINLYITEEYLNLDDDSVYKGTSEDCQSFLPEYNGFEFTENVNGFYIFDGRATFTRTTLSFVLELKFDTIEEYEQFVLYEHQRCNYTDKYNVSYNGYDCCVTTDEELTSFWYKEELPFKFGMICQNKDELCARYVYVRVCELSSVDEEFLEVFECTNCDW